MLQPYRGRCWKLPDDVSSDQLIEAKYVFDFDPQILKQHLLKELRPEIAREAQPGDILFAGENFANGSNHSHPFLAMKALGLGLVCRSISRGPYRLAVFMGIPLLTADAAVYQAIADGDQLEVDFAAGSIVDERSGRRHALEPLPPYLIEIVQAGGGLEHAKLQWDRRAGA
jgi:3-isopropylmalate/(R)-2-methylmalate dehydratase small subunit